MGTVFTPGGKIKQVWGCTIYRHPEQKNVPEFKSHFVHSCPQLCGERLLEAQADPVPPERCGEADDSAVLCDCVQ